MNNEYVILECYYSMIRNKSEKEISVVPE